MAAEWRDSFQGDLSPWWFWQLYFYSVWGRCPAERGEPTQRYAQLSAQLSAGPCNLGWSCFHTTLRCTESIHFLWSLHRKFSGLLVRPWISSAVADGTVFAWLSWPVFECVCSPSQVLGDVYNRAYLKLLTLSTGVPLITRGVKAAGVSFWSPQVSKSATKIFHNKVSLLLEKNSWHKFISWWHNVDGFSETWHSQIFLSDTFDGLSWKLLFLSH